MVDLDIEAVVAAARASPGFVLNARFLTGQILFRIGDAAYRLELTDGEISGFARDESDAPADVVVAGPADAWEKLLMAVPPPPYDNPLLTGQRVGFSITGNFAEAVAPFYPALRDFLDVLRQLRSGPPPQRPVSDVDREFDSVTGRYMYVSLGGIQHRIYFEEAGHGPVPLILQHTAAADGRQWRHIMEDPDFQRMFRMVSFDLPYHGKSLPPTSVRWWEEQYLLKRESLIETVIAVADRLKLDRPVFMGCSVGGFLAPDIALAAPDRFRAVIGINAGLAIDLATWPREIEDSYLNQRVSSSWVASLDVGLTAPTSPEALRREVGFVYSQSSPTVPYGDIHYYVHDHRLSAEEAGRIDTSKIAVYLWTCEYDALAYDDGTALLARAITGSHFMILPGLGHFGAAENPEDFKAATLPVFEEIARIR